MLVVRFCLDVYAYNSVVEMAKFMVFRLGMRLGLGVLFVGLYLDAER